MTPGTRELYELAERLYPAIHEHLRDIDTELAELHQAGMELQRRRVALLQDLLRQDASRANATILGTVPVGTLGQDVFKVLKPKGAR